MPSRLAKRAIAALFGVALVVAPLSAQTGSVTGRVTDAESGKGLDGALVSAIAVGNTVAGQSATAADGAFRIDALAPGSYSLQVDMVGYQSQRAAAVRVVAGQTTITSIQLKIAAFALNPVVVSASKKAQKATDAPASVSVIGQREIESRPVVTPAQYLRSTPGVDIITQGVQSTNVVVRGFNNIFSGALHMLTDYRLASVPSLRVNVMHFIPTTSEDLSRIEVVLGPGSALYGPNTADGVLHFITKSPLAEQGTSLAVEGGDQSLFQISGRTAQRLGDRVGFKVSGQYTTANEFPFIDPVEVSERQKFQDNPVFRQNLILALGGDAAAVAEANRRIALIGTRDNAIERWSADGRLDWQATDRLTAVFQAGTSLEGSGIELTGLGAGQAKDWRYSYYQARANLGSLFGQVYLNTSDAGDTYLLRTGQPIVDHSRLWVAQIQHGLALWDARQKFTYGFDYYYTDPRTEGTINGKYENEDQTTEVGGYVQSETTLSPRLELVLAGRVDHHSALPDAIFSPRAALVFKPLQDQSFRITYNRAFSTPTSLNQFLDLATAIPDPNAAALGFSVRVQGTGTTGFHFQQPGGGYLMRVPSVLGGPSSSIPADVAPFFPAAVGALAKAGKIPADLAQYLSQLHPSAADVGTMAIVQGQPVPVQGLALPDIAPIRESLNSTVEGGYRGVIANRLSLSADLWFERRKQLVTPLTVTTPLLTMNGQDLAAFLVPHLIQDLGMSQQEAIATATQLATGLAQVPLGVITSPEVDATGAQLLATYTNVDESIDLWGTDIGATALLTDNWSLRGTVSFVNKDHFDTDKVGLVTLNAPKRKGSVELIYREAGRGGLSGDARVRFNSRFPVQSGVYNGTACINEGEFVTDPCVKQYTLADLTLGYALSGPRQAALQLSVQNIFDTSYQSFPGVPTFGRMAVLQLKYGF